LIDATAAAEIGEAVALAPLGTRRRAASHRAASQ